MHAGSSFTNQLLHETSPYLQQHAHNPVEWYPWGQEALESAKREDKPILLSVGYSACHWCHVMAHESFEDAETARIMNELFINIKVDREERPDLDKIYQTAHHLLTQRTGGWPLTMFLMPDDQTPFFGGTYFPPESRHGLPSFTALMHRIAAVFRERRGEILQQNTALREALQSLGANADADAVKLNRQPIASALRQLDEQFDERYGGFGGAPKFPHPTNIEFLLRQGYTAAAAQRARHCADFTLTQMAHGGIYDQLGGGFCRYSVDERWMIPHFEKMLYDNGPLLMLYAQAAAASGQPLFRRVARETAQWVMRDMQSKEGGYYSTLDADSEGEEGKFYVWANEELRAVLGAEDYALSTAHFGLHDPYNFEGHAHHLHIAKDDQQLVDANAATTVEIRARIDNARAKLLAVRNQRVPPGRDEKILSSWNGLMIQGMAAAGRHLREESFIISAECAVDFLRTEMWRDGRLLATYKDGRAHLTAYLDDYAFLIAGLLELLQTRWRSSDLQFALQLTEAMLTHFEDRERGGFYFTADDHEQLLQRPKPLGDEATPSGNGIAAQVLGRLGHLLGEPRYLAAAERTLQFAWPSLLRMPYAHVSLLQALDEYLTLPEIVILRGNEDLLQSWRVDYFHAYAPHRLLLAIPSAERELPAALADKVGHEAGVTAYLCKGMTCAPPLDDPAQISAALQTLPRPAA